MDIEELHALGEKDTHIDDTNVGKYSLELPHTTHKWLSLLSHENIKLEALEIQYNKMKKEKGKFYRYDYEYKLDNKGLQEHMDGDPELNKIKAKYVLCKEKINYIESIIKTLNQASFNIGNFIKWQAFKNGVNI